VDQKSDDSGEINMLLQSPISRSSSSTVKRVGCDEGDEGDENEMSSNIVSQKGGC
jgi:hypothetical protein